MSEWNCELKHKYRMYRLKKLQQQDLATLGKTAYTDSQRNKFYNAEFLFVSKVDNEVFADLEEAQKFVNRVTKSKLWKEVNKSGEPAVVMDTTNVNCHAMATPGTIWFNTKYPIDKYTLLHELAHCAGNLDHDVGFRQCLLRLVSRFMGVATAKVWKQTMRENKIKLSVKVTIKEPEEWLKSYKKAAAMRAAG